MEKSVGFIGLGSMGLPMAHNLLKAGYRLCVYNRNKDRAASLVAEGATVARHPQDLLDHAEIIISMIANDQALEDIVNGPNGLASHLSQGVVHVSMSTVAPATVKKHKEEHAAKGAALLSATVTGRPEVAAVAKLWIFLAGEKNAKARVKPILEILGQKVFDLGEEPELSNVYKLMNNFLLISAIEAMGEALAFGEKNGLPAKVAGGVFTESQFACPAYRTYAPIIGEQKFEPAGFSLELGFKDMHLLKDAAWSLSLPLLDLVYQQLKTCMDSGWQKKDWSVIAKLCQETD